ncbi:heavy-metal-associated domain-containing protein [Enterococcus timonensis]|uniref:heavy-metal-associated domain-containing protein n=1 Tax=Enterococcus timonensis TaxID=1852364 RepID=UPI0008DA72ED|nr:cation transporter [Enterococcus timonensis]
MKKIIMQLDTLSCPSCMQKIESAVSQQAGVSDTKVLFNASKIKANFNPDEVTPEKLSEVVEKLGYDVKSVKVKEA